jgi:hypothetical protein
MSCATRREERGKAMRYPLPAVGDMDASVRSTIPTRGGASRRDSLDCHRPTTHGQNSENECGVPRRSCAGLAQELGGAAGEGVRRQWPQLVT